MPLITKCHAWFNTFGDVVYTTFGDVVYARLCDVGILLDNIVLLHLQYATHTVALF